MAQQLIGKVTLLSKEQSDPLITKLKEGLRKVYGSLRDDGYIHISDINLCSRRSLYRLQYPEMEPIDDRQVSIFARGESLHNIIKSLIAEGLISEDDFEFEREIKLFDGKVMAHIDIYDKKNNIPYELKTATPFRLDSFYKKLPKKHNLTQLQMYMASTGATVGYLIYYVLTDYNESFCSFEVLLSSTDRQKILNNMKATVERFEKALAEKNPNLADSAASDEELVWYCQYCPFKSLQYCKDGYNAEIKKMNKYFESKQQ